MRSITGPSGVAVAAFLICASLFHLWLSSVGILDARLMRALHLTFLLPIVFILFPALPGKSPLHRPSLLDLILAVLALIVTLYIAVEYQRLDNRLELVNKVRLEEVILGTIATVIMLEATRRVVGLGMAVVFVAAVGYLMLGEYLPGILSHGGISYDRAIERIYLLQNQGIFGTLTDISVSYLFIFVLFGAFVDNTGIGQWFSDLSNAIMGRQTGGPAKIAVLNSALFGSINGSPTANVYGTGVYTIPLMKKLGYSANFAGAVEASASTGGQIMPPVMGASVFIMMSLLGLSYLDIITAATPPAILFFLAIGAMTHFEALRRNIRPLTKAELPDRLAVLKRAYFFAPIAVLMIVLFMGYTPVKAALAGILTAFIISIINHENRMTLKRFGETLAMGARSAILIAIACAASGVIVSSLTATGLGLAFSGMVVNLADNVLLFSLVLTAITAILLGMGMPTTPAYVLAVTIAAPALIDLGVQELAAHMFVFYFAIVSGVTPPVAITAYAAAGISGGSPMGTGVQAFKLSAGAFIIPFMFVYSPSLLLQGTWTEFLTHFPSAVIGMLAIAGTLVGYVRRPLPFFFRLLLFAGGVMLTFPNLLASGIGLALMLPVVLQQFGWLGGRKPEPSLSHVEDVPDREKYE